MTAVELRWDIRGKAPADHGYTLYSAVSHRLSTQVHDDDAWSLAPVDGDFRLRCPLHLAPVFAAILSGEHRVAGDTLVLSAYPRLVPIEPSPTLHAAGVTIKAGGAGTSDLSEAAFEEALLSRLGALGVMPGRGISYVIGERRRAQIKAQAVFGYEVSFAGLPPAVSLRLQAEGLGGRRKMGWGWFA